MEPIGIINLSRVGIAHHGLFWWAMPTLLQRSNISPIDIFIIFIKTMDKIIDSNSHQIDISLFLQEITPIQAETLFGGYCPSLQGYPDTYTNDIAEIMNQSKKPTKGADNKYSNQKINTIDKSKKTYLNGVEIPRKGKTVAISF